MMEDWTCYYIVRPDEGRYDDALVTQFNINNSIMCNFIIFRNTIMGLSLKKRHRNSFQFSSQNKNPTTRAQIQKNTPRKGMHVFNLFVVLRYALIICVFETCSEPIAELQTSSPYFVEENSFTLYIPFICTYDVRTNRTQWLSTATGYNLNYQKLEIVDVGEFVDLSGTQSSKTFAIVLQRQTDASLDRECHACNDFIVNVKCADSDAPDGGNTATVNIQVSGVFEAPVLQPSRFPTISTSELSVVAGATIGSK
jgi:hypothetical protein